MQCFIRERVSCAMHECGLLAPPNCFGCQQIFREWAPDQIGVWPGRVSCEGSAHNCPSPREEFYYTRAAKQELHAYRFTLENLCGYQLPEIPRTYPIKPVVHRLVHIWGRPAQLVAADVCVFANSKYSVPLLTLTVPVLIYLRWTLLNQRSIYYRIERNGVLIYWRHLISTAIFSKFLQRYICR